MCGNYKMKPFIVFFLTFLFFSSAAVAQIAAEDQPVSESTPVEGNAAPAQIAAEDQACQSDGDCMLIPTSCNSCCPMQALGALASVNASHAKAYEALGTCTPEHYKACGVPECGLSLAPYPVAACTQGRCTIAMHPSPTPPNAP